MQVAAQSLGLEISTRPGRCSEGTLGEGGVSLCEFKSERKSHSGDGLRVRFYAPSSLLKLPESSRAISALLREGGALCAGDV